MNDVPDEIYPIMKDSKEFYDVMRNFVGGFINVWYDNENKLLNEYNLLRINLIKFCGVGGIVNCLTLAKH